MCTRQVGRRTRRRKKHPRQVRLRRRARLGARLRVGGVRRVGRMMVVVVRIRVAAAVVVRRRRGRLRMLRVRRMGGILRTRRDLAMLCIGRMRRVRLLRRGTRIRRWRWRQLRGLRLLSTAPGMRRRENAAGRAVAKRIGGGRRRRECRRAVVERWRTATAGSRIVIVIGAHALVVGVGARRRRRLGRGADGRSDLAVGIRFRRCRAR